MKKIVLFLVAILFSIYSFSQEENSSRISNQLGIHSGFTTGVGLSYRYWSNSNYGVQLTLLPIKTHYESFVSGGLTGLYNFHNRNFFRSFLYLGNHIMVNEFAITPTYEYNAGFGAGIEFGKVPRINLMVGYGAYDITGDFLLLPTIEVGLYFDLKKK